MTKSINLKKESFFIVMIEVTFMFLGKFFSWAMPVLVVVMGLGLALRTFFLSDWSGRILFALLSSIVLTIGILLFRQRRNLDW